MYGIVESFDRMDELLSSQKVELSVESPMYLTLNVFDRLRSCPYGSVCVVEVPDGTVNPVTEGSATLVAGFENSAEVELLLWQFLDNFMNSYAVKLPDMGMSARRMEHEFFNFAKTSGPVKKIIKFCQLVGYTTAKASLEFLRFLGDRLILHDDIYFYTASSSVREAVEFLVKSPSFEIKDGSFVNSFDRNRVDGNIFSELVVSALSANAGRPIEVPRTASKKASWNEVVTDAMSAIANRYNAGVPIKEIAEKLDISETLVSMVMGIELSFNEKEKAVRQYFENLQAAHRNP